MYKSVNSSNDEKISSDSNSYNIPASLSLEEDEESLSLSSSSNLKKTYKPKKFKIEKVRKYKEDNLRKKFKANCHKTKFKDINIALRKSGSKKLFESFPQHFIADITQKTNYEAFQLTYCELFDYTYQKLISDENYKSRSYNKTMVDAAEKKHHKNKETLEYLEANPKISKKSGWEKIKNTKYIDILKDYYNSNAFKQSIENLKKKENMDYINLYIYYAKTYTEFYSKL